MKKILIILICLFLLFPVNIVLADKPLISQENTDGFSMNLGKDDCVAQKWQAIDLQLDVYKISLNITSEFEGLGRAVIASGSETPPDNESSWLNYKDKPLVEMDGWVDFNLNSPVIEGEYYWILFKIIDGNATVHGGINDPYANGSLWFGNKTDWVNHPEKDMAFRIYGNKTVQPQVQTLNATHIENNSTRLWGKILDDGRDDCEIKFELQEDGETIDTSGWNGSYNTSDTFYEIITGLKSNTEYRFRAGAKNSNGTTWPDNWKYFTTDICDNIPENHAVLFFPLFDEPERRGRWWDEYNLTMSVLESHGWTNIYPLLEYDATEENLISTLENLSDDPWDTTLIVIATHGDKGSFKQHHGSSYISYSTLNEGLSHLKSCGIAIVIEACYSGSALWPNQSLIQDGRIILTSKDENHTCTQGLIEMVAVSINDYGDYKIHDPDEPIGNRDGAVSMNEVYSHIDNESFFLGKFWRGYPYNDTEMPKELHITFQNWTTGRIDQLCDRTLKSSTSALGNLSQVYNRTTGEIQKLAQSFIPQFDTLTKVQINMRRNGGLGLNSPIKVEIRKDGDVPGDTLLGEKTISPGDLDPIVDLPTGAGAEARPQSTFITFDIDDTDNFDVNETLYILIEATENHDAYEYKIGGKTANYYDEGCLSVWNCSESKWVNYSDYDMLFVTYGLNSSNMPPHIPKRPGGPNEGLAGESCAYNVTTTDMNGDLVKYMIDWGDNESNTSDWEASGDIINVNHIWESSGVYPVKVKVIDENLQNSNWSDVFVVTIRSVPNKPIIDGPSNGVPGNNYEYTFTATDPDGDDIEYNISWGDNSYTGWLGPYASGTEITEDHTWSKKGIYSIEAKARDNDGESECAVLEVTIPRIFGYTTSGGLSQNIKNNISGSKFTMLDNGTANCIIAFIQTNPSTSTKTKCMIYRVNDSKLIQTTEEKILNTGGEPLWVSYNCTVNLTTNTEYILTCWSNDTCNLFYDNASNSSYGKCKTLTYGDPPTPSISWDDNESRFYSIYCIYSTVPEVKSVFASPNLIGLGFNTTITVDVESYGVNLDTINISITNPNSGVSNFSMTQVDNDTFQYIFNNTWVVGQYNYSIWVLDEFGANCSSTDNSFNVSVQATISVCTIKDEYGNNETVNLTDPPPGSPEIGYELLDGGDVLHIWNRLDSYYFDINSGIQLTNHYNEYWSHNVLMLGYYNYNGWNLIYRTDELSGFNKDITTGEGFVNATLWKDLSYGGYDFRLAIRYHLGVNDNELTVIPYIKNIDNRDIPFVLGFGWEMKDIQIGMTPGGDYIDVNRSMYSLDQTLDNVYADLSETEFYLMENITSTSTKSLYLKWNQSLTYKLQVKSREGQYNAPVTLFVRIGTLNEGQEKYTRMYWYDAEQATFYFNSYNAGETWSTNPGYMVDGSTSNSASTTIDGDIELCDGNNCSSADLGTISKVELKVYAYCTGFQRDTNLRPVFGGTYDGEIYRYQTPIYAYPVSSEWFDITYDPAAPQSWSWSDVENLDCDVEAGTGMMSFTLYCSQVEIRVTYTPYSPSEISNPYPSDGSIGVSLTPTLNITVSDADGDSMDITWLSNSSGNWATFGTNNSVGNGTYHQVFSNASVNGQWWYWKVNVTDGSSYNESSVYKFYTGYQSKIKNVGSTNFSGYLLIQVQFYNETNQSWVVADDTINETTPRMINAGSQFGLDTVFNGNVNTSDLIASFGNGTYRVYACFRDPDGDVLVCDDETLMEDTYEFTVTDS